MPMNSIDSQPPAVNFETVTTTSTTPVATAPMTLIAIERTPDAARRGALAPLARQWTTIPLCDSVNDVNTPITYSWISRVRSASNA